MQRNSLEAAYRVAEALYDNANNLALFLQVWSRYEITGLWDPEALDWLAQNVFQARTNLEALEEELRRQVPNLPLKTKNPEQG